MRILAALLLVAASCGSPAPPPLEPPRAVVNPDYDPEARLADLGITLPEASAPVATYANAVRSGDLLFLAGKAPRLDDGTYVTGRLGDDLSVEQGYEAARLTAIQHLAVLKAELGDLRHVRRVVKVTAMVNATTDFLQHPDVVNGYSDLMAQVFGDRGRHARSAVGMASLPMGIAVEIEAIVEVD